MRFTSRYGLLREFDYAMEAIYGNLARCADADMAFSYFEDFINHSTAKSTIFELIMSFGVVGEILFGIFSQSNTLSSYLINNSQKIFWLIDKETIEKLKTKDDFYKEIFHIVSKIGNFDKMDYYLRQYRKNEYLRIATKEIIDACSFEDIMKELSNLASALIEAALFCSKKKTEKRYGQSYDGFSVIGMGKLGNSELNFSSDIDLLFVHKDEQKSEYYNRLARTLISTLNDNKEGGFVYRVDMRLRPGGKTAALSLSIDEYEEYYATFGQMWEKMSLTKAYPVAGDKELGVAFLKTVEPFVYRKSLDMEYIAEIRSLMFKIKKYSAKNIQNSPIPKEKIDVKKGVGGIREIEFIVNYFQLIYGGKNDSLKHTSTLKGLSILAENGYIEKSSADFLKEAYIFLRRIEHKIQLLNEQQTQNLPIDEADLEKLAKKLKMTKEEFVDTYKSVTDKVHSAFNDIFIRDYKIPVFSTIDDVEGFLNEHKIKNSEHIASLIKDSVKKFLAKGIKRYKIEELFDYVFRFVKKDMLEVCINGFLCINPTYIIVMFEDKRKFDALLKMLSVGLGRLLSKNEELFEYFMSDESMEFSVFNREEFEKAKLIDVFYLLLDNYGYSSNTFNRFTLGFIKSAAVEYDRDNNLCIVGYGKLATGELFAGSDLDLIFISLKDSYNYTRIVQSIVKRLKNFYDVDLRLRPYGDKGPIVVDVDYLQQYFKRSAWAWEKQAAQKSKILYCGFNKRRVEQIYNDFVVFNPPTKEDILEMKRKIERYKGNVYDIKSFEGGINDIEFLAQSICFENGCVEVGDSCLKLLDKIESLNVIDTKMLKEAYVFYKTLLNTHRLFSKSSDLKDFATLEFLIGDKNLKEKTEEYRILVKKEVERWFED